MNGCNLARLPSARCSAWPKQLVAATSCSSMLTPSCCRFGRSVLFMAYCPTAIWRASTGTARRGEKRDLRAALPYPARRKSARKRWHKETSIAFFGANLSHPCRVTGCCYFFLPPLCPDLGCSRRRRVKLESESMKARTISEYREQTSKQLVKNFYNVIRHCDLTRRM